jgi:hypothetical protein
VYTRLNHGWNADPNVPDAHVVIDGAAVVLDFRLNAFEFPEFVAGQRARLRFEACTRYRLGPPNDEGWYANAPAGGPPWGEFYELDGSAATIVPVGDWTRGPAPAGRAAQRRFLFYLRDATFECEAAEWSLTVLSPADRRPGATDRAG